MKRIFWITLFLMCFTGNIFASSREDFCCKDIRLGDSHQMVIDKLGQPKVDIEKIVEDRMIVYYIYKDFKVGIDKAKDTVVDMRLNDRDYTIKNGVKLGATPHKILKEYGKTTRERKNGHMYYIYYNENQKLMFDISAGYLEEIRITSLIQ